MTPSEFEVLLALAPGEKHGYAIMTEVKIGPGTLYTMLERLLDRGLVEESARKPAVGEDRRRRYYRLSRAGRRALSSEVERLEEKLRDARRRLTQHA